MTLANPRSETSLPAGGLTNQAGGTTELRDGLLVGRAAHADLQLQHSAVSREHAIVRCGGSSWTVTDCGSRNGTVLNGIRIPMYVDCPIRDGDRLELGGVVLTVHLADAVAGEQFDRTSAMSLADISAGEAELLSHYQLQVVRRLAEPWARGAEPATNAEIAAALGTPHAVDAVKAALRRAYVKTGLVDLPTHTKRRELCRVALDRRWL